MKQAYTLHCIISNCFLLLALISPNFFVACKALSAEENFKHGEKYYRSWEKNESFLDFEEAVGYLGEAANQGHKQALDFLADMKSKHDALSRQLTTSIQKSTFEEKKQSYLQKFDKGESIILDEESQHVIFHPDHFKNPEDLQRAAEAGDANAQFVLGMGYIKQGRGTIDMKKSSEGALWLRKAALQGCKPAANLIAKVMLETAQKTSLPATNRNLVLHTADLDKLTKYRQMFSQGIMVPFSNLYPSNGIHKVNVPIRDVKDYCDKLFGCIKSFEEYKKYNIYVYVADVVNWLDVTQKSLTSDKAYEDKDYIYLNTVASILNLYLENLLRANFFDDFPQKDKLELLDRFYELTFIIASNYLFVIGQSSSTNLIQNSVKKYREYRKKLKDTFGVPKKILENNYIKELDEGYNHILTLFPHVAYHISAEQPQVAPGVKLTERQLAYQEQKRKEHAFKLYQDIQNPDRELEYNVRMTKLNDQFGQDKCNIYFLPQETIKEYTKKFSDLEQFAFSLKDQFNSSDNKLSVNDFISLYGYLSQRHGYFSNCPKCSECGIGIYWFIQGCSMVLILNNDIEQALIRLQALEAFYSKKTHYPEDLDYFLAVAYAQCGQYDKLSKLHAVIIQHKLKHQEKLKEKHQKRIEHIKEVQKQAQASLVLSKPSMVTTKVVTKDAGLSTVTEHISEAVYEGQQQMRKQGNEARLKRHQEAEKARKESLVEEDVNVKKGIHPSISSVSQELKVVEQTQDLSSSKHSSILHFHLPNKAFHTVSQIFNNDWKISRANIENLFNELGQTINTATKSSHHIIHIPSGIALINSNSQIVGMVAELSANARGHLSLPNWEKEVPFYMRRQIQKMLALIGLNQLNYSKGNRDNFMQFASLLANREDFQDNPSNTPAADASKKNKRKNKPKTNL
jgi:TPR repeat protein